MSSAVDLLTIFGIGVTLVLVIAVAWRATRRMLTVGDLKDVSVSREWLMQHQSDDRS